MTCEHVVTFDPALASQAQLREDIERIIANLDDEAQSREWCSDYQDFLAELNAVLRSFKIEPKPAPRKRVNVTFSLDVPDQWSRFSLQDEISKTVMHHAGDYWEDVVMTNFAVADETLPAHGRPHATACPPQDHRHGTGECVSDCPTCFGHIWAAPAV